MSAPQSEPQRHMYALEKTDNFRWVSSMFAQPSPRHLTSHDLAHLDLQMQLADIGQYAELALGKLPSQKFIWKNMDRLLQPSFPLEGYNALRGSELVSPFTGSVGNLKGYIARQSDKLIVAFSGTSNVTQTLNNIYARLTPHSTGGKCAVHGGFWRIYNGVRTVAMNELAKALQKGDVHEVVLTGHSLGATTCYLFALDILQGERTEITSFLSSKSVTFTLAVFGCPRVGNLALVQHWRKLCTDRLSQGLVIREYSIKNYNDGVPLIPPRALGFHHFSQTPFYFFQGCLFQIPTSEAEYACFVVDDDSASDSARSRSLEHPLGGHNYYNGRDMERIIRTMNLLCWKNSEEADWEGYPARLRENGEDLAPRTL